MAFPGYIHFDMVESKTDDIKEEDKAVGYVFTNNLPDFFQQYNLSLFVTTYQAQRLLVFSPKPDGGMNMLMRIFPRLTGLAVDLGRMAIAAKNQIHFFRTITSLTDEDGNELPHDLIYTPTYSQITGDLGTHQITWHKNEIYIANTRFSCIATLSNEWSFVPYWKPPFITEFISEDRCHLNGFCFDENGPRYATALGETNSKEGWREDKANGGILIDVPSGEIITRNLCMPHTPVLYANKLWVLDSGTGYLLIVDPETGKTTQVARFPGFLRGLTFFDRYAFVGLCQIREKKNFGGLPIEEAGTQLKCAIYIIDISSSKEVGHIEFTKGIEELFDIQILIGPKDPHVIGFQDDSIDKVLVIPEE